VAAVSRKTLRSRARAVGWIAASNSLDNPAVRRPRAGAGKRRAHAQDECTEAAGSKAFLRFAAGGRVSGSLGVYNSSELTKNCTRDGEMMNESLCDVFREQHPIDHPINRISNVANRPPNRVRGARGERVPPAVVKAVETMELSTVLSTVLPTVGFKCFSDENYRPRNDRRSLRFCVAQKALSEKDFEPWREIRVTGELWFDNEDKVGGRGAVSLIMHICGLKFVDAVQLLSKCLL
jgi:hypothetical protein